MKNVILLLAISPLFVFSFQMKGQEIKKESILDNISHIEDSIYYKIDSLPMLCDELDMQSEFIDIGDCKLFCEVAGTGFPLVLINGGPGGTHHCFHPWFQQAEGFCRVIYYDQRGCGQSDYNEGDGYTFRQAIDDLDKLRQKLNIDKWIVCGYSYGGALAQYYTARYPEHVMGLITIGSSPVLKSEILQKSREQMFINKEERSKIRYIYSLYRQKKINLFQLLYNKELNGDWKRQSFYKPTKSEVVRQSLYEWVQDTNFNSTMSINYSSYDFKGIFDNNPIPTLLCEGKWDLTWLPQKADIYRKNHPNAEFKLFENSGHTIFSEEPELFFSTLEEFTNSLKPISEENIREWKNHVDKILTPQEEFIRKESSFFKLIDEEGVDKACKYFINSKNRNKSIQLFSESKMNMKGYDFFERKDYDSAIKLFQLNIESYPSSWNTYDSLAEAYMATGNKEKAKEFYSKSIELNPNNEAAKEILKKIYIE